MIKFVPSIPDDLLHIESWISQDPWHLAHDAKWWLTGNDNFLAFCIDDASGSTMYVRFDKEDDYIRMHVQFGPESEVSKGRVIKAILQAMPQLIQVAKKSGAKAMIFNSVSDLLIKFMYKKFNFKPFKDDDYVLEFEQEL